MNQRGIRSAAVDLLLLAAIVCLLGDLLMELSWMAKRFWQSYPRPGVQVQQQYVAKSAGRPGEVDAVVDYLLYLPPEYHPTRRWPLVVFLHGSGECGQDVQRVRWSELPEQIERGARPRFILVSPQCPQDAAWDSKTVVALVEHVSDSLPVDRDRVYLTGVSMGGYGTWNVACYDPSRFAAIVPVAGGGDVRQAERLARMPIWAFHGAEDQVIPLSVHQAIVQAVREHGGQVLFTVYPRCGHGIGAMVYQDRRLWPWLLAQRRGPRRQTNPRPTIHVSNPRTPLMIIPASLLATVLLSAGPRAVELVPQAIADRFEECQYRDANEHLQKEPYRYRLFVPRHTKPSQRYPLLVWLHGYGENGSDNRLNLKYLDLVLDDPAYIEKYRFFILVVQCPPSNPAWFTESGGPHAEGSDAVDMLGVTFRILQKLLREQPVDRDRVYLLGVSGGGDGCWEMATRYPEVFAAVVPMASRGGEVSQAAKLIAVPIWAFHSLYDPSTPPGGQDEMVTAVNRSGGNACLTLLPSKDHDCWHRAFHDHAVVAWLLQQRREAWIRWTPPGCEPWQWWHVLAVPAAFVGVAIAGRYSERKRRRRILEARGRSESEVAPGK